MGSLEQMLSKSISDQLVDVSLSKSTLAGKRLRDPEDWDAALPPNYKYGLRGEMPEILAVRAVQASRSPILWITLNENAPLVWKEALPAVAPVISYSTEISNLAGAATSILKDILGEEELEVNHDPDWDAYPEVGQAILRAGGAEECQCVCICNARALWAVGCAGKWKHRENSAKLALCVALAWNTKNFNDLAKQWPEFGAWCRDCGYLGAKHTSVSPTSVSPAPVRLGTAVRPASVRVGTAARCPVPLWWLDLPDDGPMHTVLRPLPARRVLAIAHCKNSALQGAAHNLLCDLVGDISSEIQIHDDPGWCIFPEVVAAVKQAGAPEECFCVGVCSKYSTWVVALGGRWKQRESAAKLALCLAIAPLTPMFNDLIKQWSEFDELCAHAYAVDMGTPPAGVTQGAEVGPGDDCTPAELRSLTRCGASAKALPRPTVVERGARPLQPAISPHWTDPPETHYGASRSVQFEECQNLERKMSGLARESDASVHAGGFFYDASFSWRCR